MAYISIGYLVGLLAFVWIVYDILTNQKKMDGGKKAMWIILGFFFSLITAIFYYFMVFKK